MKKKCLFTNIMILFVLQVFTTSCLLGQKKVVTNVVKEYTTSEPDWTWNGICWHHPEKVTDTIPYSYHVKITTETCTTSGLKTESECQVAEKAVAFCFESAQPGWVWNSDRKVWLYHDHNVDGAFPGEYVSIWKSDIVLSECKTKRIIKQVSEEQKVSYRLVGSDWRWDEQKRRWLLKGIVKTPEYDKMGTEIYKSIK